MRRPTRTTHPLRATLLGAAGAVVLLLVAPTTGAYAAWSDSAPIGGTVTTGSLGIDQDTIAGGSWTKDGAAFDPATDRLTAGTTATYTVTGVPVTAVGNNLEATFTVSGAQVPAPITDHVSVSVASNPAPVAGADSDADGRQDVALALAVTADTNLPSIEQSIDLSALTVTLTNGHAWSDTATLDAGILTTGRAAPPGDTSMTLMYSLALDDDGIIGFYLDNPAPGTTIAWGIWDGGTERTTEAVNGLNSMDYGGLRTNPNVKISGAFDGLGSAEQTASLVGALTHVSGWSDDYGTTSARHAFKDAVNLQNIAALPSTLTDTSYAFQNAGSAKAAETSSFEIVNWDSSQVTTMAHMFDGATNYRQYKPAFDTSSVTDMSYMFAGATRFTGPTDFTSTANVTTMEGMFQGATSFISASWDEADNITRWDVSNVTNMSHMFEDATSFNRQLQLWDVASVTDMSSMFRGATAYNQNLNTNGSRWDVSNVTTMAHMFDGARTFNGDISQWKTGNVTDMSSMFENATAFNGNIGGWTDTSSVENMSRMFMNADNFTHDLDAWDTASVIDMSYMFAETENFSGDVRAWDLSSVTDMSHMFQSSHFNYYSLGVAGSDPHWDVSNVEDMSFMFAGSTYNHSLTDWDASSVTNMTSMFQDAAQFNQDLSGWTLHPAVVHDDFGSGANTAWVANASWQPQWGAASAVGEAPAAPTTSDPAADEPVVDEPAADATDPADDASSGDDAGNDPVQGQTYAPSARPVAVPEEQQAE